jgi:hypothetical protein
LKKHALGHGFGLRPPLLLAGALSILRARFEPGEGLQRLEAGFPCHIANLRRVANIHKEHS